MGANESLVLKRKMIDWPLETELLVNESAFFSEFLGRKEPGALLANLSYTKVGRKKKKQIKNQLKKQFGEQARGETFKSLLKKQFMEQFKEIKFGRPYTIKLMKGLKATLMYSGEMRGEDIVPITYEGENWGNYGSTN